MIRPSPILATLADEPPLAVDLDGTLIHTDLLHESALQLVRQRPLLALALPQWLAGGKALLKRMIAERAELDAATLPYNEALLERIRAERAQGRRVLLVTASDQRYADAVAAHLGLFDEAIGSDGLINLSGRRKAERLVQRFGAKGFDYVGNSRDDLPVWRQARRAIVVNAGAGLRRQAQALTEVETELPPPRPGAGTWLRAMRPHQWLKNLLVLLPLAGAHRLGEAAMLGQTLVAFAAFSLCASAVYVLNDLLDLQSDRAHPRKRQRPFAAGQLSVPQGLAMAALLLLGAGVLAARSPPAFAACLASYFGLTLLYSLWLKRRVLVDCITLGLLYTLRIVAGWLATGLTSSFWLLSFSLFLFLSLAFVKRYSELMAYARLGRTDAHGRGYQTGDLPLVQTMGVAAAFSSALVLALYINGDTVRLLYAHPEWLWLTVPIHLYWISRMWMKAQRAVMDDDPVVFALRDRYSLACGAMFVGTLWAAR